MKKLLIHYRVGDCVGHAEESRITREKLFCDNCSEHLEKYVYLIAARERILRPSTLPRRPSFGRVLMVELLPPHRRTYSAMQPGPEMPELVRQMVGKAKEEADGAIFEIDSPGGTPYSTKEIAQAIKGFGKPTVARIKENGLSGAYWIASSCDRIVADELSRVGGIGVSAFQPDFSELLEKLGIKLKSSATGKYKEQGMPFGGGGEDFMEEHLEEVNEIFAESVAEARDLDEEEAEEVFEGKPYLGRKAKEVGLVDRLGGREEAVEECREMMGSEEVEIVDYGEKMEKESKGLLGSVLDQLFG